VRSEKAAVKHLREVSVAGITRTPFVSPGSSFEGIPESELIRLTVADLLFSSRIDTSSIDTLLIASSRPLAETVLEEASSTCRLLGCDGYIKVISVGARVSSDLAAFLVAAMKIKSHESQAAIVVGAGLNAAPPGVPNPGASRFPSREVARQYPSNYTQRKEYVSASLAKHEAAAQAGRRAGLAPVILPPYYDRVVDADALPDADRRERPEGEEGEVALPFPLEGYEFMPAPREGLGAILLTTTDSARSSGSTMVSSLRGFTQIGLPHHLRGAGAAVALECLAREETILIQDIEVFEVSEVTSAQALSTLKRLQEQRGEDTGVPAASERDDARINPAGGALAYGTVPSAGGIRMLASLMESMMTMGAHVGALAFEDPAGEAFAILLERA
jgi:acetyl-CoA acetyltransferase